jgi:hypothetical protein
MDDSIRYAVLKSVTRDINISVLNTIQLTLTHGLKPISWNLINGVVCRSVRDSVWVNVWDVVEELTEEMNDE